VQGAILLGYHADIVVWKPEAQFHLDESHAVYHKHRVCFLIPEK
jgi:allantoinase/DNA mismatch repair protein MutS2